MASRIFSKIFCGLTASTLAGFSITSYLAIAAQAQTNPAQQTQPGDGSSQPDLRPPKVTANQNPAQANSTPSTSKAISKPTQSKPVKTKAGFTSLGTDTDALKNAQTSSQQFESTLKKEAGHVDASPANSGQKQNTGEAVTPTNLSSSEQTGDLGFINKQAELFNEQYLIGEAIQLALPKPNELLSLGAKLPPIRLEASYTEPTSLKDLLRYALDNNLTIRISDCTVQSDKWLLVAALGGFLPNIIMNFQDQYLQGTSFVGGVIPTQFATPNVSTSAGFQFFGFQGGRVLFNALSNYHVWKAAKHAYRGSINDVLLNTSIGYYNLIRNQALLQIQTRAVEVSRAQVVLNQQLEQAGTGTKFQVLQAQTQLATDEQNLLNQQVALRAASIDLATLINLEQGINLLSVEQEVRKKRLLDQRLDINALINIAVLNRPELKQFESLRTAARRNIQVAASSLYPQMQFFASVAGNGPTLSRTYQVEPGTLQPVQFLSPVQNGSSGTVAKATLGSTLANTATTNSAIASGQPVTDAGYVYSPPTLESRQIRKSYTIGWRVDWNYPNAGVPTFGTVMSARALARQALLNSNNQLLTVIQQVRETYLTSQTAERQIEVTTKAVISSAEELRLARVRLANGVGTNIDVINAQRDFTTSLVNKADAIVQFNIAQAQLMHDIGVITYDNLTSGRLLGKELMTP
jgi:outer membrane protein TolC